MRVFEVTNSFPREERVAKLTDCDGENSETDSGLDFARDCAYIPAEEPRELTTLSEEVGKMLGSMILCPKKFLFGSPPP